MNKNVLIILGIIGLGVVGFFVFQDRAVNNPLLPNTTSQQTTTTVPQALKTPANSNSNWATYNNKEYGFSVEYSSKWMLQEYSKAIVGLFISVPNKRFAYTGDILIHVYENPDNLSMDKFVLNKFSTEFGGRLSSSITIDGQKGFFRSNQGNTLYGPSVEVLANGYYYRIMTKIGIISEKDFKEFLSRIKFSKPQHIVKENMSGGEFTDLACGYKLVLPSGWSSQKGTGCHELSLYGGAVDMFTSSRKQLLQLIVSGKSEYTEKEWLKSIHNAQEKDIVEYKIGGYSALRFPAYDEDGFGPPTTVYIYYPDRVLQFGIIAQANSDSERTMLDIIASVRPAF